MLCTEATAYDSFVRKLLEQPWYLNLADLIGSSVIRNTVVSSDTTLFMFEEIFLPGTPYVVLNTHRMRSGMTLLPWSLQTLYGHGRV